MSMFGAKPVRVTRREAAKSLQLARALEKIITEPGPAGDVWKNVGPDTYIRLNMDLPPEIIDGEPHYYVEQILDQRGQGSKREYLVKWVDFDQPTWNPAAYMEETQALDTYLDQYALLF
jgi:chromodomain-containing protein